MAAEFRLDPAGIAELLKSAEVAAVVHEAAATMAEAAARLSRTPANDSSPPPIPTHEYETDRVAVSVSAPAGLQAVHGVLTQAAAEAGLELREHA